MAYELLKVAHVLGAIVLLGTGGGIALFMVLAHRTGDSAHVAMTAGAVVFADATFTATAVVAQPLTGLALAWTIGWPLTEPWIVASVALYVLAGVFWLPVVWMQLRMRDLARVAASEGSALPAEYHRLYRRWFACGFPGFGAVIAILWLMIAKPSW